MNRAIFDPRMECDDPKHHLQTKTIIRCKSLHWAYEQEWRHFIGYFFYVAMLARQGIESRHSDPR